MQSKELLNLYVKKNIKIVQEIVLNMFGWFMELHIYNWGLSDYRLNKQINDYLNFRFDED